MNLGDIIVAVFVALLGLLGLIAAGHALDQGMYVFGLSLFGFALVFDWGIALGAIRRAEAAAAAGGRHG